MKMLMQYLPKELISLSTESEKPKDRDTIPTLELSVSEQMKRLQEIPALDLSTGLSYCMNDDSFYLELLQEYINPEKEEKLRRFYASEDWDNYRIIAHALKSTSLTIGAVHMSETAKALEFAAKDKNKEYIRLHHDAALEEFTRISDQSHSAITK